MQRSAAARFLARTLTALVLGASLAALPACSSTEKSQSLSGIAALAGEWKLDAIEGKPLPVEVAQSPRVPELTFTADGNMSGSGGVNRLMSKVNLPELEKGNLVLSPVASTMMAGTPIAMETETRIIKALGAARTFKVSGKTLTISDGKKDLLSFTRAR